MIYSITRVPIVDNTGVKFVRCVRIYKPSKNPAGFPGAVGLGSVYKTSSSRLFKKGELVKFVILTNKCLTRRLNGLEVRCTQSSAALVSKQSLLPLGRRILGPVLRELRFLGYLKIISIAILVL